MNNVVNADEVLRLAELSGDRERIYAARDLRTAVIRQTAGSRRLSALDRTIERCVAAGDEE